jgi:hypothetical protein
MREIGVELNVEIEIMEHLPVHDNAYTADKAIRLIPFL